MSLRYEDGSLATITYLANAHRRFPKETFEVFDGRSNRPARQFQAHHGVVGFACSRPPAPGSPDKGQSAQIQGFLDAVRSGGPMPISLESLTTTTRATLAAAPPVRAVRRHGCEVTSGPKDP